MARTPDPHPVAVEVASSRAPTDFLSNARAEVDARGLRDTLVVDCDCHHYESSCYREIARYIESPSVRVPFETYSLRKIANSMLPGNLGDRDLAGRIWRDYRDEQAGAGREGVHPVAAHLLESMDAMAIDYAMLFPTPMLVLGTTPQIDLEVELSRAYNRWLVEQVLPASPAIRTMLYLPMSDPDASASFVEEFADAPGVSGFLVTAVRYQRLYEKRYLKVFAALEERALPLAFHSAPNWSDRPFEQLNRFIGVHALGFPFYAMIQMTALILNGIPERFPGLRLIFMEAGVSWVPFMIGRLDSEYVLRSSEAPLLTRKPGDYIRECYFTTQPLEMLPAEQLAMLFELIDAERTLLYASDYPHQDFDLPTVIHDLPFLSPEAKRRILGDNALELFGLDPVPPGRHGTS